MQVEPWKEGAVAMELWGWVGKETTGLQCLEQMPSDAGDGFVGLGVGQGCILSIYFIYYQLFYLPLGREGSLPGGLSLSWDILGSVVLKVLVPLCSGSLIPTPAEYPPKPVRPLGFNQCQLPGKPPCRADPCPAHPLWPPCSFQGSFSYSLLFESPQTSMSGTAEQLTRFDR